MEPQERWRIDPDRSTLSFSIHHAVLLKVVGQFQCWGGEVSIGPGSEHGSIHIWVDLTSIDTGSTERDQYILSTELFDVRAEPGLVFDADRIEVTDPSHGRIVGWLAIHCSRRRITISIERVAAPQVVGGVEHLIFRASASVSRRALGLRRRDHIRDWLGEQVLDDKIEMMATIELVRDGVAPSVAPAPEPPTTLVGPRPSELSL